MHLGRGRQRLYDLRLAAAGVDPVSRESGDERRLFLERIMDVAGLRRHHDGGLVAVQTGLLNKKTEIRRLVSGFVIDVCGLE